MIERDDTVRFIGRRVHWVVTSVNGDKADVIYSRRVNYHTVETIQRTVRLDRIELVRKGNRDKDALIRLLGEDF